MNIHDKVLILIPAYMPDQRLVALADTLYEQGFTHQLIIDDGSGEGCRPYFSQIEERPFCTLITHEQNMGKGQALKTGLKYFCDCCSDTDYVLMADADGQHDPDSITAVAEALREHPYELILGVRNFVQKQVPLHNRLGNNITKSVMSLLMGKPISDTQTGLRAMNKEVAAQFLELPGQRYEYEINMLLECKTRFINIFEVPIQTIYINKNETSHFNPLVDSTKIYWQIIKYSISSGLAAILDIGLFMLLAALLVGTKYYIFISTLIARVISLLVNYYTNRKAVFKSQKRNRDAMLKYTVLCVVNIFLATWMTDLLMSITNIRLFFIKLLVSLLLSIFNFFIQKKWIF